jgi:hypothetical protein
MAKKKVKRAQRVQVKDVSPKNYLTYTFLTAAVIVFASVFVFLAFDYFGMPSITGMLLKSEWKTSVMCSWGEWFTRFEIPMTADFNV